MTVHVGQAGHEVLAGAVDDRGPLRELDHRSFFQDRADLAVADDDRLPFRDLGRGHRDHVHIAEHDRGGERRKGKNQGKQESEYAHALG